MDPYREPRDGNHYRRRSRSREKLESDERNLKKRRSRSPRYGHHHNGQDKSKSVKLPFRSHHLHKNDYEPYKFLFRDYLVIQKGLYLDDLDEHEIKGRWKSFLNKWNRGELAEGWYDPVTKEKADQKQGTDAKDHGSKNTPKRNQVAKEDRDERSDDEEDDDYGPVLPGSEATRKIGPAIPNFQDLQQRREQEDEDREARIADLRYERKQDRNIQKERLEEIAPKADAGSRERQLEKKRDTALSNRAFAEAKEAGAEEVADSDMLGDDGGDAYKAKMRAMERQKNEREIKKEEVLRARAAEREEKMAEHRRKEAKTMEMLKSIAQQRFGGGS
jgi:hypothetical protein